MDHAGNIAFGRVGVLFVMGLALAGCDMATGAGMATPDEATTAAAPSAAAQRVIERDVEAPDVFQRQEPGLWDGRPSLGGVWVAHPQAADPERVVIRNARTGATVIGALFRRERDNPGPQFQISSEAASALGVLAGAPTEVQVTALRLQRVEMEIDPAPEPATAATETLAVAPVATAPTPAPAAAPAPAAVTPPAGSPVDVVPVTDVDPAPRRGLRDLFRRQPSTEPGISETALAPAVGAATAATATATAATTASSTQTMTELTSVAPAQPRRRLRDLFRREEPAPDTTIIALPGVTPDAAVLPAAPVAPPVPAQPAARIDRPFVQIGIFSVESNAENARAQMQRAGLGAEVRRGRVGENQFWRVVVGPATSTDERGRILAQVRGLGFADAYAVVR